MYGIMRHNEDDTNVSDIIEVTKLLKLKLKLR